MVAIEGRPAERNYLLLGVCVLRTIQVNLQRLEGFEVWDVAHKECEGHLHLLLPKKHQDHTIVQNILGETLAATSRVGCTIGQAGHDASVFWGRCHQQRGNRSFLWLVSRAHRRPTTNHVDNFLHTHLHDQFLIRQPNLWDAHWVDAPNLKPTVLRFVLQGQTFSTNSTATANMLPAQNPLALQVPGTQWICGGAKLPFCLCLGSEQHGHPKGKKFLGQQLFYTKLQGSRSIARRIQQDGKIEAGEIYTHDRCKQNGIVTTVNCDSRVISLDRAEKENLNTNYGIVTTANCNPCVI